MCEHLVPGERSIAPELGSEETVDGKPTKGRGEQEDHEDRKPRVENGVEEHTADCDAVLSESASLPGESLAEDETEDVGEHRGERKQEEGARNSLGDDSDHRLGVLRETHTEVAGEEVGHVVPPLVPDGSVQTEPCDDLVPDLSGDLRVEKLRSDVAWLRLEEKEDQ